jgi:hypothetical protein
MTELDNEYHESLGCMEVPKLVSIDENEYTR